jgi:hypothetical protein
VNQPPDHQPDFGEPSPEWGSPVYSGWSQPPITEIHDEPWQPPYSADETAHQLAYQPAPVNQPRRKLPWILGSLLAAFLLLVGAGALVAYQTLNGGGTQPEEVVPASAVALLKLDLNPSASQKIAAARFLNKLPKVGSGFTGSGDWRKPLFDAIADDGSLPSTVSFDRDIKPWLGKRLAVAVLPSMTDGEPDVLLAVQSTDDTKAKAGVAKFGSNYGISFLKGYAVLGASQQLTDRAVAQARTSSLASSAQYHSDLGRLGTLGIASGWADLAGLKKLASVAPAGLLATDALPLTGRFAFTVRFSSGTADLIAKLYGQPSGSPVTSAPLNIGDLPASTAVAIQASGPSGRIDSAWAQFQEQLSQFSGPDGGSPADALDQLGISMPGDLDTLLGSDVLVAVDSKNITSDDLPEIGVLTRTDGQAASKVLDRLRAHLTDNGGDFPLHYRATAGGVVAATDEQYLAKLLAPSGDRLSKVAGFRQAVPDLRDASAAAFVNLDAIGADLRAHGTSSQDLRQLTAFRAIGLTVATAGDTSTLHVRLVAR